MLPLQAIQSKLPRDMKTTKTNANIIDLNWLPPAEEWDFRSVTSSECPLACHWEYEREKCPSPPTTAEIDKLMANAKKLGGCFVRDTTQHCYYPSNYRQAARDLFPRPWVSLTTEERQTVLGTFFPPPVLQVRQLKEFFNRMPTNGMPPDTLQGLLHHSYVIIPSFQRHGVEAVIKEFEKWARKQAKEYPASRRAQAAGPPFDALKWLAVARLDKVRREAKVTIQKARETVMAYRQANPQEDGDSVLPVYASDGAWSKANSDCQRCMKEASNNPLFLLGKLI